MEASLISEHMIRLLLAATRAHAIATCRDQKLAFVPKVFDTRDRLKATLVFLNLLLLLLLDCIVVNLSN